MTNHFPVSPAATRVFAGFKRLGLSKEDFYGDLASTFMPGTPYMQAPLGLNGYIPAVLDPESLPHAVAAEHLTKVPDEVALIVYPTLAVYQAAREHSLRRRMYTHSHLAVFDMAREGGGGQFPQQAAEPSVRGDRLCWNLFDGAVDWQEGVVTLLFGTASDGGAGDHEAQVALTQEKQAVLEGAGVDQLLGLATPLYVALWVHSESELAGDTEELLHGTYQLQRHLVAEPFDMLVLEEDVLEERWIAGPSLTSAAMINFRFPRDLRFKG